MPEAGDARGGDDVEVRGAGGVDRAAGWARDSDRGEVFREGGGEDDEALVHVHGVCQKAEVDQHDCGGRESCVNSMDGVRTGHGGRPRGERDLQHKLRVKVNGEGEPLVGWARLGEIRR